MFVQHRMILIVLSSSMRKHLRLLNITVIRSWILIISLSISTEVMRTLQGKSTSEPLRTLIMLWSWILILLVFIVVEVKLTLCLKSTSALFRTLTVLWRWILVLLGFILFGERSIV